MRRELQKAIKRKAEREKEKEAREEEMVRPQRINFIFFAAVMVLGFVCLGTFATNERS